MDVATKSPLEHNGPQLQPLSIIVVQPDTRKRFTTLPHMLPAGSSFRSLGPPIRTVIGGNRQWRVALEVYRFLFVNGHLSEHEFGVAGVAGAIHKRRERSYSIGY